MSDLISRSKLIEQKSEWVNVEDRLPDLIPCSAGTAYSEAVCVITEDRIICTAIWNGEYWIGDFDYWEADWKTVTHWKSVLPLPEPPKEEYYCVPGDRDAEEFRAAALPHPGGQWS